MPDVMVGVLPHPELSAAPKPTTQISQTSTGLRSNIAIISVTVYKMERWLKCIGKRGTKEGHQR